MKKINMNLVLAVLSVLYFLTNLLGFLGVVAVKSSVMTTGFGVIASLGLCVICIMRLVKGTKD